MDKVNQAGKHEAREDYGGYLFHRCRKAKSGIGLDPQIILPLENCVYNHVLPAAFFVRRESHGPDVSPDAEVSGAPYVEIDFIVF
jgi:hypothetical protein